MAGRFACVRILVLEAGGVGAAMGAVAKRRDFFEHIVFADVSEVRARIAAERTGDPRFEGIGLDATDRAAIVEAARAYQVDATVNAVDPRFNPPIFAAAFGTYLYHVLDNEHAMREWGTRRSSCSPR